MHTLSSQIRGSFEVASLESCTIDLVQTGISVNTPSPGLCSLSLLHCEDSDSDYVP